MGNRCICFRAWNEADQTADEDETKGVLSIHPPSVDAGRNKEVKEEPVEFDEATSGDEDTVDGSISMSTPTSEKKERPADPTPPEVTIEEEDEEEPIDQDLPKPSAPEEPSSSTAEKTPPSSTDSSPASGAEPEEKPTENIFAKKGGFLITQVMSNNRRVVRKLELDTDLAVLSWTFEKFIGRGVEKIELEKARIMNTSSFVKIGVSGARDFFAFEACDVAEAENMYNCLMEAKNRN